MKQTNVVFATAATRHGTVARLLSQGWTIVSVNPDLIDDRNFQISVERDPPPPPKDPLEDIAEKIASRVEEGEVESTP